MLLVGISITVWYLTRYLPKRDQASRDDETAKNERLHEMATLAAEQLAVSSEVIKTNGEVIRTNSVVLQNTQEELRLMRTMFDRYLDETDTLKKMLANVDKNVAIVLAKLVK